jgi:hypothetical protein
MDKKNLQELAKMGLSKKTISLMTESEVKLLFEKINKKKETKEATQDIETKTTLMPDDVFTNVKVKDMKKLSKLDDKPLVKTKNDVPFDTKTVKDPQELSDKELAESKKKSKQKYNPWAVCTSSVGRKNKKKYEDCVMGVKKKLKEGKNPYEYIIESKMEEIVENHLAPKISKKELIQIVQEKKMMMKKPIGKSTMIGGEIGEGETKTKEKEKVTTQPKTKPTSPNKNPSKAPHPAKAMMKGETMEGDTKTAPTPVRTTPAQPKTRPASPNRNPNPDIKTAPAKAEQKKEEIINAIAKLIGKGR